MKRKPRLDLSRPSQGGLNLGAHYDPDAFGRFSEGIARFLGTGRFLAAQTVFVSVWIALNVMLVRLRWDPYPFILLNLAFSTQAAYAAPLILLAQNRQDARGREQAERDRELNARTQADTEYVARELAAVRVALADVVSSDDLDSALRQITESIATLRAEIAKSQEHGHENDHDHEHDHDQGHDVNGKPDKLPNDPA